MPSPPLRAGHGACGEEARLPELRAYFVQNHSLTPSDAQLTRYACARSSEVAACLLDVMRASSAGGDGNSGGGGGGGDSGEATQTLRAEHCPPHADEINCWSWTAPKTSVYSDCPREEGFVVGKLAYRMCSENGTWSPTDYKECIHPEYIEHLNNSTGLPGGNELLELDNFHWRSLQAIVLKDIYFYGSIVSLLMLVATLAIFCSFKSLQCPRVHIHKNLVISYIVLYTMNIVIYEPYIMSRNDSVYQSEAWSCKLTYTFLHYILMTNVFWTFIEGLFMYCRIAVAVFNTDTPYALFHTIGWGLPVVFAVAWSLCMASKHPEEQCWRGYSQSDLYWIINGPVVVAVAANVFFLVNIIIILVTKLNAAHSAEHVQIRKATKATVVLLPLLNLTSLFFVSAPPIKDFPEARLAYSITNSILQTSQGMFIAVLYCFLNGEVRAAVVRRLKRLSELKIKHSRTTRISSICTTQTEHLSVH